MQFSATFMRADGKRQTEPLGECKGSIAVAFETASIMAKSQTDIDHCAWRVITVKEIIEK